MSKHHEDRARKLHARLTAAMQSPRGHGLKHSVGQVDRHTVTVDDNGAIVVAFLYCDGTESEIDFAPKTNAYEMAREAKKHAVGHCSEIREARETAMRAEKPGDAARSL